MALPIFPIENDPVLRNRLIQAISSGPDAHTAATADTEAPALEWMNSQFLQHCRERLARHGACQGAAWPG